MKVGSSSLVRLVPEGVSTERLRLSCVGKIQSGGMLRAERS